MTSETEFYQRTEHWLYRLMELEPVLATELGDHRWDDRLPIKTPEAQESEYQEILQALDEFRAMDAPEFGRDAQIDQELVVGIFEAEVLAYEKQKVHRRSPGLYLEEVMGGVFVLIMREFAPLSERLHSILGRVREIPRFLDECRPNLVPSEVPSAWAEICLEQCQQAGGLFAGLLPALAAQAAPDLQSELAEAGRLAAQAVQSYAEFVGNEILPQAKGDFAVGRAIFDEMLRERHMVDYDADQLLETGWEQFHHTRAQMEAVAQEIDPNRSVQEILEEAKANHPAAGELLDVYRAEMATTRQYVVDHDIITIPAGESLRIVETPVYLRPIMPYAAYMRPGILDEKQEGLFLVTPVDPDAPPEEQEQRLKGHNWAKLPVVTLHEGYPGHHLQLVWSNRHAKVARRMGTFLATQFIEGWAFYCEELMEQLGYIAEPVQRLGRLSDQLWRAARIILDVSLHTRGMSVDEAVDFLVKEAHLEPANALAEVRRYTLSPTQPQCYLMGKLAILELVADYRKAHPDASLHEVHDAIMRCGSLPPRLLRQQLGLS